MEEINKVIDRIIQQELSKILNEYGLIVIKFEETLMIYEESEDYELAVLALNEFERQTNLTVNKVWELFDGFDMTDGISKEQIKTELQDVNNEIRQELRNNE